MHVALLRQTSAAIAAAPRAAVPTATGCGARAAVVPTAAAAAGAAKRAVQVSREARAAPPRSAALCHRRRCEERLEER